MSDGGKRSGSARRGFCAAEVGQHNALDRLSRKSLDGAHRKLFNRSDERYRAPTISGAARAANAMHIIFGRFGHVVVDDVRNRVNVNAARGDIGRYEHARLPVS